MRKSQLNFNQTFINLYNRGLNISEIYHLLKKEKVLNPVSNKPYSYSTVYRSCVYFRNNKTTNSSNN